MSLDVILYSHSIFRGINSFVRLEWFLIHYPGTAIMRLFDLAFVEPPQVHIHSSFCQSIF